MRSRAAALTFLVASLVPAGGARAGTTSVQITGTSSLTGSVRFVFSEDVTGVTGDNVVLRVPGTSGSVAASLRCRNALDGAVSCAGGTVRSVILDPEPVLVTGQTYRGVVSPDGAPPVETLLGDPVPKHARDFRTGLLQQETSPGIDYTWRRVGSGHALGGSYLTERNEGARTLLRFTGGSVTWITRLGPSQGKARVYVDGEPVRTVNNYRDEARWQVARRFRDLGGGAHTLRIVVLGAPGAPGGGTSITVDGFRAGAEGIAQSAATYLWGSADADGALGGAIARTLEPGARATLRFRGRGVDWVARVGPAMGRARLIVDGVARDTIDTYAASPGLRRIEVPGLTDAVHTVAVVALGTKRAASSGTWVAVDAFEVANPPLVSFRGLGAWVDLYDYKLTQNPLNVQDSIDDMAARGVRTLYIQTARYNTDPIAAPLKLGNWLEAAHAAGIRVVGWYLPGYDEHLDHDVTATVAMATFRSEGGEALDAVSVDIEYKGETESPDEFNDGIVRHLRRVRLRLGTMAPIAAIVPSPVAMALYPSSWTGFPWAEIGRYSDVVMPMAYWTYREDCPEVELHCPYRYARANIKRAADHTGLPVHIIGGVGDGFEPDDYAGPRAQVEDFVDGSLSRDPIGGSFYDYATMDTEHPGFWEQLARYNTL